MRSQFTPNFNSQLPSLVQPLLHVSLPAQFTLQPIEQVRKIKQVQVQVHEIGCNIYRSLKPDHLIATIDFGDPGTIRCFGKIKPVLVEDENLQKELMNDQYAQLLLRFSKITYASDFPKFAGKFSWLYEHLSSFPDECEYILIQMIKRNSADIQTNHFLIEPIFDKIVESIPEPVMHIANKRCKDFLLDTVSQAISLLNLYFIMYNIPEATQQQFEISWKEQFFMYEFPHILRDKHGNHIEDLPEELLE